MFAFLLVSFRSVVIAAKAIVLNLLLVLQRSWRCAHCRSAWPLPYGPCLIDGAIQTGLTVSGVSEPALLTERGSVMKRPKVLVLLVAMLVVAGGAVAAVPAGAYGGGANHDMWQVGVSGNCNNPSVCNTPEFGGTGGFWGWAEFDRSADRTQTWGDAEFAFCFHTVDGGGAGAGHTSLEIESWTIAPGSTGPHTFYASGEETDTFRGTKTTFDFTNMDTGITAVPGHYSTSEVFGFTAPGVAFQAQVAFRPGQVALAFYGPSSCVQRSPRGPWAARHAR
jgi:hypothetical protein